MENYITNIELKNNYIIITYSNNQKIKILYTKENRLKVLEDLNKYKHILKPKYKQIKLKMLATNIIFLFTSMLTILECISLNSFLLKIIILILSLDILFINYLLILFYKEEFLNLKKILTALLNSKLPNEDIYLNQRKIIDIKDYLDIKLLKEINSSNEYSNDLKESGKILIFKKRLS